MYGKVTDAVARELQAIAGVKNVIFGEEEKMLDYSHDEVAEKEYAGMPEIVVKVSTKEEISQILRLANREKIPVTPRGAGSGLSGGAVPMHGGILLSLEKMNRILEIDKKNLMVVVEPGVVTNEINNILKSEGLFFAGYPMSLESCFIGGNVAENAGGGKAIKYGVTGRYVHGLEVVLPGGDIVTFGGKRVKDVTGYNMVQLLVGSEGTLGIFTEIIIKLLPLPKDRVDLLVLFKDIKTAINVVPTIMTQGKIIPTSIEFMDRLSLETAYQFLGEKTRYEAGAILLIELDGNDKEKLVEDCLEIGELCMDSGAIEAFMAEDNATQEKIWGARRCVAEAFKAISPIQSLEDIVVPISQIPTLVEHLQKISSRFDILLPCYGHAGDGNLHATLIKKPKMSSAVWKQILPQALEELYRFTRDLGGTISGEHGIGHKRKKYMHLVLGRGELEAMKAVKRALDPNNILNPGKLFDL